MSTFQFPETEEDVVIESGMMRGAERRTLAVHRGGALVVWSGHQRIGKTTTAKWMANRINEAYQEDPGKNKTFRAVHYETGRVGSQVSRPHKQAIRGVFHACIAPRMEAGIYRSHTPESLADLLVHGLRQREIEMIFLDEAGLLSIEAIRGITLVRDVAKNDGYDLSFVLLGMDDLPLKVREKPQVKGRIHEWINFDPQELDETKRLLLKIDPKLPRRASGRDSPSEVIEWIHDRFQGIPGEVVPFYRRVKRWTVSGDRALEVGLCRSVRQLTEEDRCRTIDDSKEKWTRPPDKSDE